MPSPSDTNIQLSDYESLLPIISNFPKEGVDFIDIQGLGASPAHKQQVINYFVHRLKPIESQIDAIVFADGRGFLFTGIAAVLGKPEWIARKEGKLPLSESAPSKLKSTYTVEYRPDKPDVMELSEHVWSKNWKNVVIVDDVVATFNTIAGLAHALERSGRNVLAVVALLDIVELSQKNAKLQSYNVITMFQLKEKRIQLTETKTKTKTKTQIIKEEVKEEKDTFIERAMKKLPIYRQRRLVNDDDDDDDDRIIVFYHPIMEAAAKRIVKLQPDSFRLGVIEWKTFPDGTPNIEFQHPNENQGAKALFLGSLIPDHAIAHQLYVLSVLPRQNLSECHIYFGNFSYGLNERLTSEGRLASADPLAQIISKLPHYPGCITSINCIDLHALAVQFFFDHSHTRVNVQYSMIPYFKRKLMDLQRKVVIVTPDDGSYKRFQSLFGDEYPMIVCTKDKIGSKKIVRIMATHRPGASQQDWIHITDTSLPKDYLYVIVDDVLQSCGTVLECYDALNARGAVDIGVYATHAVCPNQSWQKFINNNNGGNRNFFKVWTTDTVPTTAAELLASSSALFEILPFTDLVIDQHVKNKDKDKKSRHIHLASNSAIKQLAVEEVFPKAEITCHSHSATPTHHNNSASGVTPVNPQPVGVQETLDGCLNRFWGIVAKTNNDIDNDLCISMENGIIQVSEKKWVDIGCVIIGSKRSGKHIVQWTEPTDIPLHAYEQSAQTNFQQTCGVFIDRSQHDDWHATCREDNKSRVQLLSDALANAYVRLIGY